MQKRMTPDQLAFAAVALADKVRLHGEVQDLSLAIDDYIDSEDTSRDWQRMQLVYEAAATSLIEAESHLRLLAKLAWTLRTEQEEFEAANRQILPVPA